MLPVQAQACPISGEAFLCNAGNVRSHTAHINANTLQHNEEIFMVLS